MNTTVAEVASEHSQALLAWGEALDQRVEWLFTAAVLIAAFYAYYLVVAPLVVDDRLQRLQAAGDDLAQLTKQFADLRDRYDALLNLGDTNGRDLVDAIRLFESQVFPPVRSSLASLNATDRATAEKDLADLERSLNTLRQLERRHTQAHPAADSLNAYDARGREIVAIFRRALGQLLGLPTESQSTPDADQRSLALLQETTMGRPTGTHMLDEPVNALNNLQELEQAIRNLREFNNRENNWRFADLARSARVSLGDTLMRSFLPFASLQEYSSPTSMFAFEPTTDLRIYERIEAFVGAPFSVTTLNDLQRLGAFVDSQRSEVSTQLTTPTVTVPLVDVTIDRFIIVGLGPLSFLGVVTLIYACQIKREKLNALLHNNEAARWFVEHARELAPHSYASRLIAKGALLWITVGFLILYAIHSYLVFRVEGTPTLLQLLGWAAIAFILWRTWLTAQRSRRIAACL